MKRNKSSVSEASSYKDIGAYWDSHDLAEVWGRTRKLKFDVQVESEAIYFAIERNLSEKVQSIAKRRGVSSDTLVNLWIQQKVQEQIPSG